LRTFGSHWPGPRLPGLCLSSLLLLVACGGPEPPYLDSSGTRLVCFGDSITAGVGAGPSPTYPEHLAGLLSEEVVNAGVSGDTTESALLRLPDVLAHDPWMVVVELGGNDLLRKIPLHRTEQALRRIVEGLLEAGVAPVLVEVRGPFGGGLEDLFDELEEDYQVPVIRGVLPKILFDPRLKSDPIHPNGEGYRQLAEEMANHLRPFVEKRRRRVGS
jgi:acyl-CoA hydrolase